MEADFLELLNQTIQIAKTTINEYGEPVPGVPTSYPARVEYEHTMTRDSQGQEVLSKSQVYLDGTVGVTAKDEITLPDGSKPLILSVEATPDEDGTIHNVVVYT